MKLLNGQKVDYKVKVSKLARRVSLRISYQGLTVVVPSRGWLSHIDSILWSKHDWVVNHLYKLNRDKHQNLLNGKVIYILGEEFRIVHKEADVSEIEIEERNNQIIAYTPVRNSPATLVRIHKYLRKHYGELIKHRLAELAEDHKFTYAKVSLRDQTTRWGSCSSRKNLNFNWRLIFAPVKVLDYVILHELAHTVCMDHSPRFWDIVAKHFPRYKQCKQWLQDNDEHLRQY